MRNIRREITDAVREALRSTNLQKSAHDCQYGGGRGMVYLCNRNHRPCPLYNNPEACSGYVPVYQRQHG